MKRLACSLALVLVFLGGATFAQSTDKPVTGYIAGGFSGTEGTTADYVNDGWNFSGGVLIHPAQDKPFAFRADLGYNRWDATKELLDLGGTDTVRIDDGWASMSTITGDILWEFGGKDHAGGYVGVGIGGYRRYVQLTEEVLVPGYICDPWWGICYPAAAVGDLIVADDKLTKIGYNAILGINFPTKSGGAFQLEIQYHRMDSEEPTEFLPILIGYRW